MTLSLIATTALAASLMSPLPAAAETLSTSSTDSTSVSASSTIGYKKLVGENIGLGHIIGVYETCPSETPYVHQSVYRGSLPQDVTFTYSGADPLVINDRATAVRGTVYNWFNLSNPRVDLDLVCTTNPHEAIPVH